jgi:hypothetical protein
VIASPFRRACRFLPVALAGLLAMLLPVGPPFAGGRPGHVAVYPASSKAIRIELEQYRTRRSVRVKVGSEVGTFLLDTAGGLSILTPQFAKRIGCEPWGRIVGFHMMGDRIESPQCNDVRFEIGGLSLSAPVAGVIDIMASLPKDAAPLDGLLALDAFAGRAVTLDVSDNVLVVETPTSLAERIRGLSPTVARVGREVMGAALSVFIGAPTAKGMVWFEIDSGNGGTILVSQAVAPLLGLDPEERRPQGARFRLTGGAPVEGQVLARDMTIDGNLGMPFLTKWRVTLDLAGSRVWLQQTTAATSQSSSP